MMRIGILASVALILSKFVLLSTLKRLSRKLSLGMLHEMISFAKEFGENRNIFATASIANPIGLISQKYTRGELAANGPFAKCLPSLLTYCREMQSRKNSSRKTAKTTQKGRASNLISTLSKHNSSS